VRKSLSEGSAAKGYGGGVAEAEAEGGDWGGECGLDLSDFLLETQDGS
jgi:hypothetical protein